MKNRDKVLYKNALKNALQRFNKISDGMDPAEVLEEIEIAFRDYLSSKHLDRSAHAMIPDIIKTIETYKYAPGMLSHVQLNELKTKALAVIEEMETV